MILGVKNLTVDNSASHSSVAGSADAHGTNLGGGRSFGHSVVSGCADSVTGDEDSRSEVESTSTYSAVQLTSHGSRQHHALASSSASVTGDNYIGGFVRSVARASNNHTNAQASSHDEWSMDLQEVDEETELLLTNPRAEGTKFIRLLVRAVGCLNCEDDVERMLLEDAGQKISSTLKAIKIRERKQIGDFTSLTLEEQQAIFSRYIRKLLDAVYLSMRKLMYVLRLLRLSKNIRSGGKTIGAQATITTEITKKSILQMTKAASKRIEEELTLHLVEQEVLQMSDHVTSRRKPNQSGIYADSSTIRPSLLTYQPEIDGGLQETDTDSSLICAPTLNLVVPVYQDIVSFAHRVHKLFKVECSMTDAEIPQNQILVTVEKIAEQELLPLVQSRVSQRMNEIQANPALFAASSKTDSAEAVASLSSNGVADSSVLVNSYSKTTVRSGAICSAALQCFSVIRPLLAIWLQLPQHSEAVVTILDRAVRGFASAAREELESLSWKLHAAEDKYKSSVQESMLQDPFFLEYRRSVYGNSCTSVEELLGIVGVGSSGTKQSQTKKHVRTNSSSAEMDSTGLGILSSEMDSWGSLWEVGATQYPLSNDKIAQDAFAVGTILAIALGCDWLTREVARACVVVSKKVRLISNSASTSSVHASRTTIGSNDARNSVTAHQSSIGRTGDSRALGGGGVDQASTVAYLITTVHGCTGELAKIAEDALAILRSDIQLSCFHSLHHLSHIKFTRPAVVSSVIGSNQSSSSAVFNQAKESDNVISSFNKHLLFLQDAFAAASTPESFAVIISPCCIVAPRIFMRCVKFLNGPVSPDGFNRILRAVVACHQSISMILESSNLDPVSSRKLQDRITDNFDKVRRYISFIGSGTKELQAYMENSPEDYSYMEYKTMWNLVRDPKLVTENSFESMWTRIKTSHSSSL